MRKFCRNSAAGLAILLGLTLMLFSAQWPLPDWSRHYLESQLKKFSVEIKYKESFFDFLGNIRLADIQGHYQGLLDFSARQVLIRLLPSKGPELVIDSGIFHTGFLRLPIPENIQFSGTIQKRSEGIFLRDTRFRAGSLVLLVHGIYPLNGKSAAEGGRTSILLAEDSPLEKNVAGFLTKLCADKALWVAQLELSGSHRYCTLAGESLEIGDYQIISPVIRLESKHSWMAVSADEVDFPNGKAKDVSASYSAQENNLWRLVASSLSAGGLDAGVSLFSAHIPLGARLDPKAIQDIYAAVNFTGGYRMLAEKGGLVPLSARIYGELPPTLLSNFNLNFVFQKGAYFTGEIQKERLLFDVLGGEGRFYGLPFDHLMARGTLSKAMASISRFDIVSGESHATGSLTYDFSKHNADYQIVGEVDPLILPWFGKWWENFFLPFGPVRPFMALALHTHPKESAQVSGIAMARGHKYREIPVDQTYAAYETNGKGVGVNFASQSGLERLNASLELGKAVSGSFAGELYPHTLFSAFSRELPPALKSLKFSKPPRIEGEAQVEHGIYKASLATAYPVDFYSIHFDNLAVSVHGNAQTTKVDSVEFGFAKGKGGGNAQVNSSGEGYGVFWLRGADLGEWPLLGPLSQMLKTRWFSFATLRLHSADGSLVFEPSRVGVPSVNLWGDEHAASASGYINTQKQTLDFSVKLHSFGGSKQNFGVIMAPLIQPIASVFEARLSGPVQSPKWTLQFASPSL